MRAKTFVFVAGVAAASLFGATVARAGDVEIVNPQGQTQAAPAPVQPVTPVVEQPAPVVAQPTTQRVVHEDVQAPHNDMATIAVSALMGGVAGALIGSAIYFLGARDHAARIGIWAAGGVLVGTGVGIVQVATDESRASTAVSAWAPDPARTFKVALFHTDF